MTELENKPAHHLEKKSAIDWLIGGGSMGDLIRAKDWSETSIGPREIWPHTLRVASNLILSSRFPMVILWGKDLELIYNDGYRVIAGNKHPQALGSTLREVWPEVWEFSKPIFEKVMQEGLDFHFEDQPFRINRNTHPEDSFFTLSFSPIRTELGEIGGVFVTLYETTSRVFTEKQLRENIARYELLTNTMSQGLLCLDSSGKIILINSAAERILGRTEKEFLDHTLTEAVPHIIQEDGSSLPGSDYPSMKAFRSGQPVKDVVCGVLNSKENAYRWINISAVPFFRPGDEKPNEVYSVFEDITERKFVADRLNESQTLLSSVIESTHSHIFVFDSQYRFRLVNDAISAFFEIPKEKLLGKTVYDIFPKAIAESISVTNTHIMKTGESISIEETIANKSGKVSSFMTSKFPLRDKYGKIIGVGGVASDITARKRAEEAAQEARTAAESANHSKDLFLSTLSHELRTPLTAILSWAQILRSGRLDPSKFGMGLQTIEESAQAQNQLISDLLDISRIGSGKIFMELQDTELTEVVAKAIKTVRASAEKKTIQMIEQLGSEPIFVSGDAGRLKQIVWNLLTNSIKFTPPGGRIAVTIEIVDESSGQKARISVVDSGKGISANYLPHVFEQFSQADSSSTRSHGGLGLGLAIVQNLVKLHHGTVKAESEGEGKGSTFTVSLPLSAESISRTANEVLMARKAFTERLADQTTLLGVRILLVDDEESTLNSIKEILSSFGAQVLLASSVPEAMAEFEKNSPDLIVSDIAMPLEDGYSLIRKIRNRNDEKGRLTPAVALTAYADSETKQKALSAGFQAHIAKPVDADDLVQTILKMKKTH